MGFRRISAASLFAIVCCLVFVSFAMPLRATATEDSLLWMGNQVNFQLQGDYQWNDGDQYFVTSNVLFESVTAKTNEGSLAFPKLTSHTYKVFPTSVGYFDGYEALPIGESRWQNIDRGEYNYSGFYGNPGAAGALVFVNGLVTYNGPQTLHYVSDWRSMFGKLTANSQGNVTRHVSNGFDINATPVLKQSSGLTLPIDTRASPAFSNDGSWIYLNSNIGQLRAHVPDLNYQYVAPRLTTGYSVSSAVSNGGRYVVSGARDKPLTIYDTTNCSTDASIGCAKRELNTIARTEYAKSLPSGVGLGEFNVVGVKFVNDAKLELYAWTAWTDGKAKYVKFNLSVDPGPQTTRYLALGDSFSSGEGAGDYYKATAFYADAGNFNECHQSRLAYSEVLNKWLTPSWYDSVACSGAQMKDVLYYNGEDEYVKNGYSQANNPVEDLQFFEEVKLNVEPGYLPQLSLLQANPTTVSTITIGGNDIGFGNIVSACVLQTRCYTNRDDRERLADLIASQIPKLKNTYLSIKQSMVGEDPHLYVVGYPKIFNENTPCNNFMSIEERTFANNLVNYLNAAVKIAASQAGVYYVDVTDAFIDYQSGQDFRLCGNAQPAANGLVADIANMSDTQKLMQYIVNSYHPNANGHTLLAKRIRSYTNDFVRSMPNQVSTTSVPDAVLYKALVGDAVDAVNEYTDVHQDLVRNAVVNLEGYLDVMLSLNHIGDIPANLSTVRIELHSTPVSLSSFIVSPDGIISGSLPLPSGTETGMHTIHVFYNDVSGQAHDVMQYIFVIGSKDDLDGDGIANVDEQCALGGVLGIDMDHDGIDDACDPEITEKVILQTTLLDTRQTVTTDIVTASDVNVDEILGATTQYSMTNGQKDAQPVSNADRFGEIIPSQMLGKTQETGSLAITSFGDWIITPAVALLFLTGLGLLFVKHKRVPKQ